MNKKFLHTFLGLLAGVLIISGIKFLSKEGCHPPGKPGVGFHAAQMLFLTRSLLEDYQGGGKLLVIHHSYSGESGRQELNKIKRFIIECSRGALEEVRLVPIKEITGLDDEMIMEEAMMEITAADFNEVTRSNQDCDLIITLVSLPVSESELFKMDLFKMIESRPGKWVKDPEMKYPRLGVFNGYIGNLTNLFEDSLIHSMTIWKPNPLIDENEPKNYKEAFDKRYLLITPENIDEMWEKYPKVFPKKRK